MAGHLLGGLVEFSQSNPHGVALLLALVGPAQVVVAWPWILRGVLGLIRIVLGVVDIGFMVTVELRNGNAFVACISQLLLLEVEESSGLCSTVRWRTAEWVSYRNLEQL